MEAHAISNVDIEEQLLACILAHPRLMNKVAPIMLPEHFYRNAHRDIYEAMQVLHQQDRRVTVEGVTDEVQRKGQLTEGFYQFQDRLLQLSGSTRILADVLELAEILLRKYRMNRLKDIGYEIMELALREEEDAIEQAEQKICLLMMDADTRESSTLQEAVSRYMEVLRIRRKEKKEGKTPGLSTGFYCLDKIFKMLPGELCTIAALTGFGKSALALNIALNAILQANRVIIFSLEMNEAELVQRILSMDTRIDQSFLGTGDLDDSEYRAVEASAKKLRACDMVINDQTYNVEEIITKAKFEHAKKPADLIIIDYVQLMEGIAKGARGAENRATEVERISRRLKQLAQTLHVPVLILSQVNREVERRQPTQSREDGRPPEPEMFLSDLSDSSGVAKNSNRVAFIYTTVEEAVKRKAGGSFTVKFSVLKNRNGRLGTEELSFAPGITRFRDETIPEESNGYI